MRENARKLGWFVGIWAASICALGIVGGLLKLVLN